MTSSSFERAGNNTRLNRLLLLLVFICPLIFLKKRIFWSRKMKTQHLYECKQLQWHEKENWFGLDIREYCRRDLSRWPWCTILALTSPTSDCLSVVIGPLADWGHGVFLFGVLMAVTLRLRAIWILSPSSSLEDTQAGTCRLLIACLTPEIEAEIFSEALANSCCTRRRYIPEDYSPQTSSRSTQCAA
jgi:hypothetical protein